MASFLAAETLKEVVERLGASLAKSSVTDFLIFKRALTQGAKAKTTYVETGLENATFQAAISEMAEPQVGWNGPPYFSPFGWKQDGNQGYKSAKYPSNGPSDTVGGWQSRGTTPFTLVPGSSPKRYTHTARTPAEIRAFFLKKSGGSPPSLLDAARWWFRLADLDARFKHWPSGKELADAFVSDCGLTPAETSGLFEALSIAQQNGSAGKNAPTQADPRTYLPPVATAAKPPATTATPPKDFEKRVEAVWEYAEASGFVFAPWHVAAFITAVRTKPFVILAGISGTGKTKLPRLVAEATGAHIDVIPVHPDWTDGSELIGYERINGDFVPGRLLRLAKLAQANPTKQYFALLDEMNIARVEYYLADILSHIEERELKAEGPTSKPLAPYASDASWRDVCLPPNLCIAGSVNMDETTHGFSRKVLDRSFVIEFSDIDITQVGDTGPRPAPSVWTAQDWKQEHLMLATHPDKKSPLVDDVLEALESINEALEPAQLHIGYRVRDEVALFRLNARQCETLFRTSDAAPMDPLDLAISMKILPRVQGGVAVVKDPIDALIKWASPNPTTGIKGFPFAMGRLQLMKLRLRGGYTSYWL
ncbi:MAG: McrB family protein [Kofleriaceae bacterium]